MLNLIEEINVIETSKPASDYNQKIKLTLSILLL